MVTTYNIDQLVSAEIKLKSPADHLQYKEAKRLFYEISEAGFYNRHGLVSPETIKQYYIVEDKKAYHRPFVKMTFSNSEVYCQWFRTDEKAKELYSVIRKALERKMEFNIQ